MGKQTYVVTDSWQLVGEGKCVVTVNSQGRGNLYFNEVASEDGAWYGNPNRNSQFAQDSIVDTYVKASGEGYTITIKGDIYNVLENEIAEIVNAADNGSFLIVY